MAAITSANVANAIAKLVATQALPALVGNLQLGKLVNRNYEQVVAAAGDTVNVPIPPTLVANNIAEGGSVQTQNLSLGNAQIVLSNHIEATVQIPDVTRVLAVPDLLQVYMQPAMIALAERIETDLLSLYPLFTANPVYGTAGSAITEATIDNAETALFAAKVPQSSPRFMFLHQSAYAAVRQIPRFSEYQTVGKDGPDNPITSGALGKIKNIDVYRSQYVVQTGSSPVTTHNMVLTTNAMALVMRRLPQPLPGLGAIVEYADMGDFGLRVVMSYQPNTLAQQFTVDCLYGVGVLRNNFAVQVNS